MSQKVTTCYNWSSLHPRLSISCPSVTSLLRRKLAAIPNQQQMYVGHFVLISASVGGIGSNHHACQPFIFSNSQFDKAPGLQTKSRFGNDQHQQDEL
jgi:hypothetical protein